jgi:O-acetyl-ADP-ribose deacetylase (regulator of RNase III)
VAEVSVVIGDVTTLAVEVIVNAANEQLFAGGGVCGAIFDAAGYESLTASCQQIGSCPTGSAVITPAHGLAANGVRHIVHAVGPVWDLDDGEGEEAAAQLLDAQLAGAYRSSLELAVAAGARSIAFPAISTGIFGFPAERAAEIAVRTCVEFNGDLDELVLVAFDTTSASVLNTALQQIC